MALHTFWEISRFRCMLLLGALSVLSILVYSSSNTNTTNVLYVQSKDKNYSKSTLLTSPISGSNFTLEEFITHFQQLLGPPSDSPVRRFANACGSGAGACSSNCSRPLSNSSEERLTDVLLSPNLTLSNQQRDTILSMAASIPESDIIFLSASSSNHYDEMQAMFHNLHTVVFPMLPNMTVVLFDIGLTEGHRKKTEKHCRCHVVTFPVEEFPPHMKEKSCYTWKPLIVRATMEKARQILVYQDASIRWSPEMHKVLNLTKTFGLQYYRKDYLTRISIHTMKQMFDYFGESPCAFSQFPELESGNGMFKKDPLIIRAVLEPWARCALDPLCMCPVAPNTVKGCNKTVAEHVCHRFDQSGIGILTAKLFNKDIHRILVPNYNYLHISRWDRMKDYFDSLENSTTLSMKWSPITSK